MEKKKAVLPPEVVERDKALRDTVTAGEEAGASLKELRWHWTRNPENPDRVSLRVYAAATGVSKTTVDRDGQSYELSRHGDISPRQSEEVVRLPKERQEPVIQRVQETGVSVRKANEEIVAEQAREKTLDEVRRASERDRERKPVEPAPVGFKSLVVQLLAVGGEVRRLADEFAGPSWNLTTEDLEQLENAHGLFGESVDALRMAVEAAQGGGVAAGAEALLKGGAL